MKRNRQWVLGIACMLAMYTAVFGDSYWSANRSAGSAWSVAGNWTAGLPDTADRANFTNTQDTDYGVNVDTAAVLKKMLIARDYVYNGTGSIELRPASAAHWDKALEVNQTAAVTAFNASVKIQGTTDYVMDIYNRGSLTFNNALTLANSANPNRQLNMSGDGTTTINGDLVNGAGLRFGSSSLTTIIGGSGTTSGRTDAGAAILLSGQLELRRASALINTSLKIEGLSLVLGADNAIASGADVNFIAGLMLAEGYDQDFGTLDLSVADVTLDMDDADSIFTFEDSSAISWGTAGLIVNNSDNAVIRFADAGLTETQIGQITLNGSQLTTGDTTVDGGYLYITPNIIPEPSTLGLFAISSVFVMILRRRMH